MTSDLNRAQQAIDVSATNLQPQDLAQSWVRVAARLRAELGDDLYNSWFGRMEPESCGAGVLVVTVPTRFLKSWIENHYITKLLIIAGRELGTLRAVNLKVRVQGAASHTVQPVSRAAVPPVRSSGEPLQPLSSMMPSMLVNMAEQNAGRQNAADENQNFDNFMIGQANQLAHAAAMRVANGPQGAPIGFNPLYIHAAAGLGKTHLLNAVANRIKTTQPMRKVMMMTAERFMYTFIQAVRQRDTLSFKDQFQQVDVLLIDDFQFLQGKAIQQEFCHSFNSLVDQKRQVIVAADVPPSQLDTVDQRMRSRLMGGLVVDIDGPDLALRRKILNVRRDQMVASDPRAMIADDILDVVAEKITGGGRELEGALNRIVAFQQFNNQPVTLDLAAMVLRDANATNGDQGRIKIDDILKVVGRHYNVSKTDLLSPRRARNVVVPRQIGMYLAKKLTARSLPEIGRRFGGRDHSTVLHAVRKIDEVMRSDEKMAKDLTQLIRLIEQGI